jgi:predicted  nucleic acid-binding Zn-ribbon protein
MSADQMNAFQAAVVELEAARGKATRLRKEVGYAENRAKRAEADLAELDKKVEALKKTAQPGKQIEQGKKVG